MHFTDQQQGALRAASLTIKARILRDCENAPLSLKRVFKIVADRFLTASFSATEAWNAAEVSDSELIKAFRQTTGMTMQYYIADARVEVTYMLMLATDLPLTFISTLAGFTHHPTLVRNFKRVYGKRPSEVIREPPTEALIDDLITFQGFRGLLDNDEARAFILKGLEIYPEAARLLQSGITPEDGRIIVNGADDDLLKAQGIWQRIHALPYGDQCRQLRQYQFRSTVLFDFLRQTSRQEGRSDRQRGVEIARLALVSIESSDDVFGGRIHDLRAHGLAWLGNAYRLALDFPASAGAFENAECEWNLPRKSKDMTVLGIICFLKGSLLMMRRQYKDAADELRRSISLHRQFGQPLQVARSLIQRANVCFYYGDFSEAQEHLREAQRLNVDDKMLTFALHAAQANAMARGGNLKKAATELQAARELCPEDRLEKLKLDFVEAYLEEMRGRLDEAATQYESLYHGFKEIGDKRCFGIVGVDLMSVYSRQGRWRKVTALAKHVLPALRDQRLYDETIASIRLVEVAIQKQALSHQTVTGLRNALTQDPLVA